MCSRERGNPGLPRDARHRLECGDESGAAWREGGGNLRLLGVDEGVLEMRGERRIGGAGSKEGGWAALAPSCSGLAVESLKCGLEERAAVERLKGKAFGAYRMALWGLRFDEGDEAGPWNQMFDVRQA